MKALKRRAGLYVVGPWLVAKCVDGWLVIDSQRRISSGTIYKTKAAACAAARTTRPRSQ